MVVAAIDTGGTKIAGAAVDESGKILYKVRYPNSERSGQFILDTYIRIVEDLNRKFPIAAIGIGAGGRIDPRTGTVVYAVNIYSDYIGLPIRDKLTERFGLPVAVDNDCRVAVYGERWQGAARGYDNVIGIILGTGLGGGIIADGEPMYGWRGGGGEIGHFILYPGGRPCGCGQRGCYEQYLSGTSMWRSYNEAVGWEALSSGQELFQRLDQKDPDAQNVLISFIHDLAVCAISLGNIFDPQALLFGGGVVDTADRWWDQFQDKYYELGGDFVHAIDLLRASSGNDAALLGAAWLALHTVVSL